MSAPTPQPVGQPAATPLTPELVEQLAAAVRAWSLHPDPAQWPTPPVPAAAVPGLRTISAPAGTPLDQLAARYAQLKPQVDALAKELEGIKDSIKIQLVEAAPGASEIVLRAPALPTPLKLIGSPRTSVNGKKLLAAYPAIHAEVSTTTTVWSLRAVNG